MDKKIANIYFIMFKQHLSLWKIIESKGTLYWGYIGGVRIVKIPMYPDVGTKFLIKYWNYKNG